MVLESLDVGLIGIFKSWKQAVPVIKKELPDFMIVDLFLENNEKGMDFINEMKNYFIPTIICSGYPHQEYMDEALAAGVVSFLAKPVDKATLTYQIKSIINNINSKEYKSNFFVLKDKGNLIKIPFDNITRVEIEGNYSFVFLDSGKKYVLKLSLKKIMMQLDPKLFMRSHRSIVVNLKHIASINIKDSKLVLEDGTNLRIGTNYKKSIKEAFSKK